MEKENKVRIICLNCLYSKTLTLKEFDPKGTRLIVSTGCPECGAESDGLQYYDSSIDSNQFNELCYHIKREYTPLPSEDSKDGHAKRIPTDFEELWDEHSELLGEDIDSLSFHAGSCIMTRKEFFKMASKLQENSRESRQEPRDEG